MPLGIGSSQLKSAAITIGAIALLKRFAPGVAAQIGL